MDWMKKHVDTVVVLGAILSSVFWMNSQFNGIDNRFALMEKDIAVIKTVLMMKNIMPNEICKAEKQ